MSKKKLVVVNIPHPKPSVELPLELADLLTALIASAQLGATTRELSLARVTFTPSMIAKLRNFGAIISEENGRGQMLTYQYKGWLDLRIEERNQEV